MKRQFAFLVGVCLAAAMPLPSLASGTPMRSAASGGTSELPQLQGSGWSRNEDQTGPTQSPTQAPNCVTTPGGATPPATTPASGRAVYAPAVRNACNDRALGGIVRTGLQAVNLNPSQPARVQVRYLRPDGTEAGATAAATVAGGQSQTYFGSSLGVAEGFSGSAVVTADQPIATIVNQLVQDTGLAASYNGVTQIGTRVFVPIALRNADGFSTTLALQNAGSAPAGGIEVRFNRLDEAMPAATARLSLAPGASAELTQAGMAELGDGFVGSAVVESGQPLAVVVSQSNGRGLLASTGQTAGAATLYGPLVQYNNGGFGSSVQIQNAGGEATSVDLTVVSTATGQPVATDARTLPVGAATRWTIAELVGGDQPFVGSITVQAGSGGRLIGVVNQSNPGANQASAYSLFAGGTERVVAPLVQTSNSGWNTGFQVQNVGTSEVSVMVAVTDTAGNVIGSVPNPTRTIPPGKSETWFSITALGTRLVGSAVASGPAGARLVGVVNQLNQESGPVDFFTTYEAINQ